MKGERSMFRATILLLGISLVCVYGCDMQTPEIRGIVIDAKTEKPVEGAWIHATVWIQAKTIGGDVGRVVSLEPPHTRTGKDGKFLIPQRELKNAAFSFGLKIDKFAIGAATIDKSGQKEIATKELTSKRIDEVIYLEDLDEVWKKELAHVPAERFQEEREQREFSGLQALYNYCLTGRSSVEVPSVKGGCNAWELDFAITKYERYLSKSKVSSSQIQISHQSIAMANLAYLYKQKMDYQKAILLFEKLKNFNKERGITINQREYDFQISELLKLMQKRK